VPDETTSLILRLSNSLADGTSQTNRVENEVACMTLARQALKPKNLDHVIPLVYAWNVNLAGYPSTPEITGWIAMEYKQGENISHTRPLEEMNDNDMGKIINQLADVYAALKLYSLPRGINKIGGVRFTPSSKLGSEEFQSDEMTLVSSPPFEKYSDYWRAVLKQELDLSDKSEIIGGWKEDGIREKIELFLDERIDQVLAAVQEAPMSGLTLIHADFCECHILLQTPLPMLLLVRLLLLAIPQTHTVSENPG
jgi:hypothetical protein